MGIDWKGSRRGDILGRGDIGSRRGELDVTLPVSSTHQTLPAREIDKNENEILQGMKNGNGEVADVNPAEILEDSALSDTTVPGAASNRALSRRNGMTQEEWDVLPKWRQTEIKRERFEKLERI